ncbi:hypothetical protein GLAREA_10278 [Glarea lozoyensis ATCC 20868]|uniref:MARVEL domain-containing protein n=1 Tax=Glarea lozoyensis (strain ATCC 20868 / MF5171) TaxID=1116229 RepID=S3DBV2_GLAL2|nr:uncharacterized protein GLAREA_10278 [Glarea lozoyensis ATCC 20868]EPE34584.1 hypothetical protein GLAREA_10278 [Glarea lozoyensis ATCC 20868]
MSTTSHVLPLPIPFLALRAVQLAMAVVVLGLTAYGLSFNFVVDALALSLFTAIATLIITIYNIVSFVAVKAAYNYWAVLGLDIFGLIFWLTSMGLMASWVSGFSDVYNYTCYYYCYRKRDILPRTIYAGDGYVAAMKGAAGVAGLEVALFIASLVITAIFLHKHRAAGGHCTPARASTVAPTTAPTVGAPMPVQYQENKQDIELGQQQPAPVYQQPIPQYPSPSPTPVQYTTPQQQQPQQPYPVYEVPTSQQQQQH